MKIEILKIIEHVKQRKELSENFTAEDIYKISKKAASTFLSVLPEDEISTCILNAIWKALEKYDFQSTSRCKFTTYLYKGGVMECLSRKKFNCQNPTFRIYENIISENNKDIDTIDMLEEIKHQCDDASLIYDRFYKNMTIKEIAAVRGVCNETIRVKINKNLTKLRLKLTRFSV